MKLACRYCSQMFHDVNHGDSWTEPDGRHHWIVSSSGLLSGQKKEVVRKEKPVLEAISPDDFFDTDPESLAEVLPETAEENR
jgi:hypothetical protein